MSVPSYSAPIALLLRLKGWRLRALVTAVTVLAAVLIVSMMSLLLQGRVSGDYLLTGLVTAAIVAPLSLALLNQLVDLLAKQHEELLAGRLAETERRLNQALVESEARLRTLIDAVPDAIQFKDGEGRWQVANQVWFAPVRRRTNALARGDRRRNRGGQSALCRGAGILPGQ